MLLELARLVKMAKIYDNPRKPRSVYRIQDKDFQGPYGDSGLYGSPQSRVTLGERNNAEFHQPLPEDDFDEQDLEALNGQGEGPDDGNGAGYYSFAFDNPHDAMRWHGRDQLKALYDAGFRVQKVPASKVFRSVSGKQVFFEHAPKQPKRYQNVPMEHIEKPKLRKR